jgi:hypothetical protein
MSRATTSVDATRRRRKAARHAYGELTALLESDAAHGLTVSFEVDSPAPNLVTARLIAGPSLAVRIVNRHRPGKASVGASYPSFRRAGANTAVNSHR